MGFERNEKWENNIPACGGAVKWGDKKEAECALPDLKISCSGPQLRRKGTREILSASLSSTRLFLPQNAILQNSKTLKLMSSGTNACQASSLAVSTNTNNPPTPKKTELPWRREILSKSALKRVSQRGRKKNPNSYSTQLRISCSLLISKHKRNPQVFSVDKEMSKKLIPKKLI
jgi:hypothetical protein